MSTYRFETLFSPRSVAIVGASPRERSLGRAVLRNLRQAQFGGAIHLINSHYPEIDGVRAVADLDQLPAAPDVVVVTAPAPAVPGIIASAAEKGTAAAIVISSGLGHGPGSLAENCERAARAKGLRIVGPNCLGVMAPGVRFNATFAARMAQPGNLALLSQSGAVAAAMIEWAAQRSVGFSAIVSIGDQLDVDLGDLLDFFALDGRTRAILLYIESVKDARKFMSAARAAARVKPVVVMKAGRHAQGAKAAATHTGALAGSDAVYDAAFRRAGLLRVFDLGELYDAVETLGHIRHPIGKRLAILTNGGGVGVLAIDRLIDLGGTPAGLSAATMASLDKAMSARWSRSNPIDIAGDADSARYVAALEALIADPENDAILVMNVQTALTPAAEIAQSVTDVVRSHRSKALRPKPILAAWVGTDGAVSETFRSGDIPAYATEADAIGGFMHVVRHGEAIASLQETPPSLPEQFSPRSAEARAIVGKALAEQRRWLDPVEVCALFAAYDLPIVPTVLAATPAEAEDIAAPFLRAGHSIAVKIASRDIVHKSDVGGVRLHLPDRASVRQAAEDVIAAARRARPEARIAGVTVQPMILRPGARELIAGLADDPTFGAVIVFGHGGTAVEVVDDKALALPPMDLKSAQDLIRRTRISKLLGAYRNVPAAKVEDIALVLVKLAQLVADVPEVQELDINPLLADESGVLALDARVAVAALEAKFKGVGHPRFAVRPYPSEWERQIILGDNWRIQVRPVRPQDEPLFENLLKQVSQEDLRLRFFAAIKDFSHAFIARLTQIDYARAMAFVAIDEKTQELIGVVRLHADANYESGEYAILLRSDLKGRGLGWKLMELIIAYARSEGLKRIEGQVLRENAVMIKMCGELGFEVVEDPRDRDTLLVRLSLT